MTVEGKGNEIEDCFTDKGFRKKLKEEGMYGRKTEKVLHNQYSRGSGRICKSGKRTLGNRKLLLDIRCNITNKTLNKNVDRNLNILRKLAIIDTGRAAIQKEV